MIRLTFLTVSINLFLSACGVIDTFSEDNAEILESSPKYLATEQNTNQGGANNNINLLPKLMILADNFIPTQVSYMKNQNPRELQIYQTFLGEGVLAETAQINLVRPTDVLELPSIKSHALQWTKISGKSISWGKKRYYNSTFSPVNFRAAKVGNKQTTCIFFEMPYKISKKDHFERPTDVIIGYFCVKDIKLNLQDTKNIFDGFSFVGESAKTYISDLFTTSIGKQKDLINYYSQVVEYTVLARPIINDFPYDFAKRISITSNPLRDD